MFNLQNRKSVFFYLTLDKGINSPFGFEFASQITHHTTASYTRLLLHWQTGQEENRSNCRQKYEIAGL